MQELLFLTQGVHHSNLPLNCSARIECLPNLAAKDKATLARRTDSKLPNILSKGLLLHAACYTLDSYFRSQDDGLEGDWCLNRSQRQYLSAPWPTITGYLLIRGYQNSRASFASTISLLSTLLRKDQTDRPKRHD